MINDHLSTKENGEMLAKVILWQWLKQIQHLKAASVNIFSPGYYRRWIFFLWCPKKNKFLRLAQKDKIWKRALFLWNCTLELPRFHFPQSYHRRNVAKIKARIQSFLSLLSMRPVQHQPRLACVSHCSSLVPWMWVLLAMGNRGECKRAKSQQMSWTKNVQINRSPKSKNSFI